MLLLDMRCLIIISILVNIYMVQGYQRRMDHVLTTQKSYYLKSNQRNMNGDYKYKDWESKPTGVYYDFVEKTTKPTTELNEVTNQPNTDTTAVTTTEVTTPSIERTAAEETTVPTETTAPTETKQETVSEILNNTNGISTATATVTESTNLIPDLIDDAIQDIYETDLDDFITVNENTAVTTLGIPALLNKTLPSDATLEDMLHWFASTITNVYTTLIPPPPTINVLSLMPQTEDNIIDHLAPLTTTTKDPIVVEIQDEINKTNDYFASSVRELIIVLSHKNSTQGRLLLMAMNSRLASAMAKNTLTMFSNLMLGTFQASMQMLLLASNDVRQEYFNYAIYALENRHIAFESDINAIFDVVETIYTEKNVAEITDVIKKVDAYPNITEDSDELVGKVIEAFILNPHLNIIGTAKEKLLMLELHTAIESRLYPGQNLGRRFGKGHRKENFSANFKSCTKTVKITSILRKHSKRIDKIQKDIKLPKYKNYQKQRAKNLMKIKSKEEHGEHRKTERRLVKGAQKIITRTSSNSIESSLQSISSTSSESGDTQDSDIERYKVESVYSRDKDKDKDNYHADSRATPRKIVQRNRAIRYKAHSKQIQTKPKRYRKLITTLDDEEMLKIRLKDALLHTRELRRFGHKLDRITRKDSYSDDEAILKSKIYKVFGFNHDISEQSLPVKRTNNV